jgi:hypothetical protein
MSRMDGRTFGSPVAAVTVATNACGSCVRLRWQFKLYEFLRSPCGQGRLLENG